jgi:hypothetical protein
MGMSDEKDVRCSSVDLGNPRLAPRAENGRTVGLTVSRV